MEYKVWNNVGEVLKTENKKRYVTPEQYLGDSPTDVLMVLPDIDEFFGTKPLNLFIAAKPYGWSKVGDTWTESWPPPGFEEAKARHKEIYEKFPKYKTYIWTDFYLVSLIMENAPESRIEEMMEAVHNHMQDLCTELAEYGFQYEGKIEERKEASFFQSKIDEFFQS